MTPAQIANNLEALKAERSLHENVWRECAQYSFPLREDGFSGQIVTAEHGRQRRAELLDGTSTDACLLLASSLMSGLTPSNSQWAELGAEDAGDEAERWLDDAAEAIWRNIHDSNYDAEALECMVDATWAGWFVLFIGEAPQGGFQFEWWPISECYVSASRSGALVDTLYRCREYTAEQAMALSLPPEQGGRGWKVSSTVRELAQRAPHEKVEFVHAIYPRRLWVPGSRRANDLPFASCVFEANTKAIVEESGYHEQPFVSPRWRRLPRSVYAVGPMFDALADVKELNELTFLEKSAIEMSLAPPLVAADDGVLNPKLVKIGPRTMLIARDTDSIKPLYDGARLDIGWTAKERLQAQIRKILMADQLQPADGPAMTATEVHVRVGLIRQLLGPVYGRFQAEYLNPLVTRCFGLMLRSGALGQVPEALAGRQASVRYVSPLARAQKLEEVTAMERLVANVGAMAQVFPTALDNLDSDKVVHEMAEALGVGDVLRSETERDERRQAQEQAQAAADQQAAILPVAQEVAAEQLKQVA